MKRHPILDLTSILCSKMQNIDTVMRLETRIMERIKSGTATSTSSSSSHRRSSSSSTNEWALLARYAAHLKQEDERKKALEAHARAEKAKEELRIQQAEALARQRVRTLSKIITHLSFLNLLILTKLYPCFFLNLCRMSVKRSVLSCKRFKMKSGLGGKQKSQKEKPDELLPTLSW